MVRSQQALGWGPLELERVDLADVVRVIREVNQEQDRVREIETARQDFMSYALTLNATARAVALSLNGRKCGRDSVYEQLERALRDAITGKAGRTRDHDEPRGREAELKAVASQLEAAAKTDPVIARIARRRQDLVCVRNIPRG